MARSNVKRAQEWRRDHPSAERARRYKLKEEVLTHYGNEKLACVKCGFDNIWALSIDHIEPKGYKKGGGQHYSASKFYNDLKKEGYPDGYQTLCMNCQWVKRFQNFEHLRPEDRPQVIRWWE